MIKNKRQQQILNMLKDSEIVTVAELSDQLHYSGMTIRRDLEYFEQIGLARRVHGGAVLVKTDTSLPPFAERLHYMLKEKSAIGKAALSFIKQGSIVCMDAGTTTLSMIQHIPDDFQFTVISTGISTSEELCKFREIEVIQVGGSIHHSSRTVCGTLASKFLNRFNADVAFLSTRALDPAQGTFESNMSLVDEKNALATISKKVVVLADHTKLQGTSLCQAIPINKIDVVITDNKAPATVVDDLRRAGIEVIITSPD